MPLLYSYSGRWGARAGQNIFDARAAVRQQHSLTGVPLSGSMSLVTNSAPTDSITSLMMSDFSSPDGTSFVTRYKPANLHHESRSFGLDHTHNNIRVTQCHAMRQAPLSSILLCSLLVIILAPQQLQNLVHCCR